MNIRSILLLSLALVVGTASALGTKMILNAIPEEQGTVVHEAMVPAMVAKKDLALGEEITPLNIRFDLFPESEIPTDIITHYKDAAGRTLFHNVKSGEMISLYHLNAPNENGIENNTFIPLKNHYVSFLIESIINKGNVLNDENMIEKVRKNLKPQVDKVDFMISFEKEDEKDAETGKPLPRSLVTETLLKDIGVYHVKMSQKVIDNAGTIKSVLNLSFILSDKQLQQVNEASSKGKITIVMKDPNAPESKDSPMIFQGTTLEEAPQDEMSPSESELFPKGEEENDESTPEKHVGNESAVAKASPFDFMNVSLSVASSTENSIVRDEEIVVTAEPEEEASPLVSTQTDNDFDDSEISSKSKLFRAPRMSVPRASLATTNSKINP